VQGNPVFSISESPLLQYGAIVAGYVATWLLFRKRLSSRLIASLTLLGLLTWGLLGHGIQPYVPDESTANIETRVLVAIAKATWWLAVATVLVNTVRVFLIFERKPHEGRLLQDLLVGLIYLGTGLSIVAYVFSAPIGTLIATSGVFAIVLGLALQNTLGDVFSGIALNLGRPYSVGDWIVLDDGLQGLVVETSWRSTHLLSDTNDIIVVPNSSLAKSRFVNQSNPDETHAVTISVQVVPSQAPSEVEAVMQTVLLSGNWILTSPAPAVSVTGLSGKAVSLDLSFRVESRARTSLAKNEIYDLLYRHAKAAGLEFAAELPALPHPSQKDNSAAPHPGSAWRLLNSISLFSTLTEDEKEALSSTMVRHTYRKNAVIVQQQTKASSLMIIRRGVVVAEFEKGGDKQELARLAPGDCFGERGVLMGLEEQNSFRALSFVVVYEVPLHPLASVMQDRPALAEELGLLLSRRLEAEEKRAGTHVGIANSHPTSIAARIRHLFQVQA
jgi:small-conductance mechanosensitive channel/CRP-like cAMP-binding protein